MKNLRKFGAWMMSLLLVFVLSSCQNEAKNDVNLEGMWFVLSDGFNELLMIDAEHKVVSMGSDDVEIWMGVQGEILIDGDDISIIFEDGDDFHGTFELEGEQWKLYENGELVYTYTKLKEEFSMIGEWTPEQDVLCFINPIKDAVELPIGSVAGGEELPSSIPTSQINGTFVSMAISQYLGSINFKEDVFEYNATIGGKTTSCEKYYDIAHNMMHIYNQDKSVDQYIRTFQNRAGDKAFLLLTKDNMADMFVSYGLQLRQENITEGSELALEAFRQAFLSAFENYAVLITFSK